jgi:rfaE bifunctional protein nucleotidyltransferase chain/domain
MSHPHEKTVTRDELAGLAASLHAQGKTIVTCNGSFDLFHYGHLVFLKEASEQGDVLIVGTNSDSSVKQYKNPNRPMVPQEQRAAILAALEMVDYVHIFDETVPMPFLDVVKPQVHANGEEYGENCIEADTVRKNGGRIHLIKRVPGLSTTDLIKRIKSIG